MSPSRNWRRRWFRMRPGRRSSRTSALSVSTGYCGKRLRQGTKQTSCRAVGALSRTCPADRWVSATAAPSPGLSKGTPVLAQKPPPHGPEIGPVRRRADGADFALFIPSDLAYVEGHFPNAPIVPGVALIHWAVKFAARHLDFPLETAQAFQVKFRRVTLPGIPVSVSLRRRSKPY